MRWVWIVAVAVALLGQQARADEDVKPDQLKKMLDDAQNRKNELAQENEKLTAKLTDLQRQLDAANANAATFAEKTYQWRATFAAWEQFLKRYPVLMGEWQAFLQADVLSLSHLPDWTDAAATMPAGQK